MKKIVILISEALFLCCCAEKERPAAADRLAVSMASTRVQLDESGHSVWTAGDLFSVFFKSANNEKWKFTGQTGATSGEIEYSGPRKETGTDVIALYPYNLKASCTGTTVRIETAATQQMREGGFAPGSVLMWAKDAGDGNLRFSYLCAFVRLDIAGKSEIKSLAFEGLDGESVAGPASIDFSGEKPLVEMLGGPTSIFMSGGSKGFTVNGSASFLFCIPAIHYRKGYCIAVTLTDGRTCRASFGPDVTPEPGSIKVLTLSVSTQQVITLDFSNEQFPLTPVGSFTVPSAAKDTKWTGSEGQAASKEGRVTSEEGDRFTFTSDGNTYELTIGASEHQWISNHSYYQAGYFWKPSSFLRFQTNGCWMKLPVVGGSRLVTLELTISNTGSKSFTLSRSPGRQEGAEEYAFSNVSPTVARLPDSDSDEAWYMYGTASYNAQIPKMVLTYEKL